jgi:hypothetical protein
MGWRERNKPEGDFSRRTYPWPNIPWRHRWINHYQEHRLWDRELGRLARSPSSLRDGWKSYHNIKLTRSWKRHRAYQRKPLEIN